MSDERGNSVGESTLTIKWWGVLVIVLGFFGWMALSVMGQETRITRMETHFSHWPRCSSFSWPSSASAICE